MDFNVSNLNCNGAPEALGTRGNSQEKRALASELVTFFRFVIVLV